MILELFHYLQHKIMCLTVVVRIQCDSLDKLPNTVDVITNNIIVVFYITLPL